MDPPANPPTRVLHVGADEAFVREAVTELPSARRPFEVTSVADGEAALARLESGDVDCVVCEHDLDDLDWQSLLDGLRECDPVPPSLVVTDDERAAEEALATGASDVLVRREGVDDRRLLRRRITGLVPAVGDADEDGDGRELVGVSRFTAEKKESGEKTRVRNRAIEDAPIGIAIHEVTDDAAPVVYANDRLAEMTGYDAATLREAGPTALFGAETDPEQIQALEDAFTASEETTVVLLCYEADGTPFWGRIHIAPVTDDDGAVTHYVGFLQDVTDTKERAEEIERRLDEFGDVLAEELRAPLETAADALATASENGDEDAVSTARQSVQRADKLIDDLTAVHSFSVTSRSVFASTDRDAAGGRDITDRDSTGNRDATEPESDSTREATEGGSNET